MTPNEVKRILIACRPGTSDSADPEVAAALSEARRDPALHDWFTRQMDFQQDVRVSLRDIPVPSGLRERVLVRTRVVRPSWWQRPSVLAVAAAIVALLAVSWFLWQPKTEGSFATYRDRMVRNVLRQYAMDIVTNDMASIRSFLATRSAPADYVLPPKLEQLPVTGAGVLSWRDRRVSMVCLDATNQGTLFLFVVDRQSVDAPPGTMATYSQVSKLMTASWSVGSHTYVLAGSGSREALLQYAQ